MPLRPIDIRAKLLDMMRDKVYVDSEGAADAMGVDEREVLMELKFLEKRGEIAHTDSGYAFPEQHRKDEKTRASYRDWLQVWSKY